MPAKVDDDSDGSQFSQLGANGSNLPKAGPSRVLKGCKTIREAAFSEDSGGEPNEDVGLKANLL